MAPFEIDNFCRKNSSNSEGYGSEEGSLIETIDAVMELPHEEQVFVNKNLNLSKISVYGFDMDYTLCEYISPEFDELAFTLAKKWLVERLDYSPDILDIKYDAGFAVRGLWFDRLTGNLLKTDQFGKILSCCHGFRMLKDKEIKAVYPGKIQRKDDQRVFVMNTLFNLAETFLVAALVDHLDHQTEVDSTEKGWVIPGKGEVTFADLFKDLRAAIDDIHLTSLELKTTCLSDLSRYVKKDSRLPVMLRRIKGSGRKTFLLTNSDWWYTSYIMEYLLGEKGGNPEIWMSYFDLVVVDARKPKFFSTGTQMKMVENILDRTLGSKLVEVEGAAGRQGRVVYSGGDHSTITSMLGAQGPDVIYAGDHLFADVIKCRKMCEWRTVLIVPELGHELSVSTTQVELAKQLASLERLLGKSCTQIEDLKVRLWDAVNKLNRDFSATGSLFRSGNRLSYFGSQLAIWSDVYTGSVNNLAGYSLDHRFLTAPVRLPHERLGEDETFSSGRNSRSSVDSRVEEELPKDGDEENSFREEEENSFREEEEDSFREEENSFRDEEEDSFREEENQHRVPVTKC